MHDACKRHASKRPAQPPRTREHPHDEQRRLSRPPAIIRNPPADSEETVDEEHAATKQVRSHHRRDATNTAKSTARCE
eukprot:9551784-Alexandrium_andersonii.AAC.1